MNEVGWGIVGKTEPIRAVRKQIVEIAPMDIPVFVSGETGVGKELVARALNIAGRPPATPFVPVNCASLTGDRIDSELFGHVRGSFTGAVMDADGLLKTAEGGTLFFDEVCELSSEAQAKLLRALDDGWFRPVGSARERHVKVRFVAASNRDMGEAICSGCIRPDLYYRLAGVIINVPPLRERRDDIGVIAEYFLNAGNGAHGRGLLKHLSAEAVRMLLGHIWPGNVRELKNAMRYAWAISSGRSQIGSADIKIIPLIPS